MSSVAVNITVVGSAGYGFLTSYASGDQNPGKGALVYQPGVTAGFAMVKVGADGKIVLHDYSTSIDVIVDILGWTSTAASAEQTSYVPVQGGRLVDTSTITGGAIGAGATHTRTATNQPSPAPSVPTGATAVVVNITIIGGPSAGFLNLYETGTPMPATSTLNFNGSPLVSNSAIVKLNASGQFNVYFGGGAGSTNYIIDILGYYQRAGEDWAYTYNGDGTRRTKAGPPTGRPGLTGTTQYAWDRSGGLPLLLQETQLATTATTPDITWYVYGPDGEPVAQIARTNGTETVRHLHRDQLGTIRAATNTAGTVTDTFTYDPYGNRTGRTGTTTINLGYNGQYHDTETGLIYLRARYYDPTTTQFLSRDPLAPVSRSAYAYANNDPINNTDPSGLIVGGMAAGLVVGLGINLATQILENLWNGCPPLHDLDWKSAARDAIIGAATGGAGFTIGNLGRVGGVGRGAGNRIGGSSSGSKPQPARAPDRIGIPSVNDSKLKNYVADLYKHANRPGTIGNGTTMDAARFELAAGGGGDIQKARNIARGLKNWLHSNRNASHHDRLVARSLYNELADLLGYNR